MRPTPEDTLVGAEALLRAVLADSAVPADASATLTDVLRMLGQAKRAAGERPTFLADDNDRMRELLAELIGELPLDSPARDRIRLYLTERTTVHPG